MSHKIRSWALVGIPCLVLIAGVGLVLSKLIDPPEAKQQQELTAKEIAAKTLPNLDKDIKLATNPDITVVEVAVHHDGGSRLVGVVRNTTNHEVASVELVVDLTDKTGSQVGGVSGTVTNVPSKKEKSFTFPIHQKDAAFALVRDILSK
jgi:sarcosine oxidase delta subunit